MHDSDQLHSIRKAHLAGWHGIQQVESGKMSVSADQSVRAASRLKKLGQTDFPKVGQEFLSGRTYFPRKVCPVGQNFLG